MTDIKYPEINPIAAYFSLGRSVIIPLLIGWLVVFLSVTMKFEVPSSGAVLVCTALIAEVIFEGQWWRNMPCDHHGFFPIKRETKSNRPIIWGYQVSPAWEGQAGALLSLADKSRIISVQGSVDPLWNYRETVNVVEKRFKFIIVTSAVVGTLVWGYAHLFCNPA